MDTNRREHAGKRMGLELRTTPTLLLNAELSHHELPLNLKVPNTFPTRMFTQIQMIAEKVWIGPRVLYVAL